MNTEYLGIKDKEGHYRANLYSIQSSVIEILHYIPRELRDYTSHGYAHSKRIIKYLDEIIKICNDSGVNITDLEAFLLYASAWLHDIGCLIKRENHAKISAKMVEELQGEYIEGISDKVPFLQWIITGHSKEQNIEEMHEIQYLHGGKIRLRFLAAIFRLADACDIDRSRAPKVVYKFIKDELDEKSKEFWEGHQNIDSVSFDKDEEVIILSLQEKKKSDIIIREFKKEFESVMKILKVNKFPCREIKVLIQKYEWKTSK
ncbi:MAG: HD domain-containing protein [Methanobacteriota archaeon]